MTRNPNGRRRGGLPYTKEEYNLYVNWVLYAALGMLSEADALMRQHKKPIERMAKKLRKKLGCPVRTIYRGLLIEPSEVPPDRMLPPDPTPTFVSFSEDKDVACWFASRDTMMAGAVTERRPDVVGWLMETVPKRDDVLFHWSWASKFPGPSVERPRAIPLWLLAAHHPHMADKVDQVKWNVETQKEVILKKVKRKLKVVAREDASCPPTAELDERLLLPSMRGPFPGGGLGFTFLNPGTQLPAHIPSTALAPRRVPASKQVPGRAEAEAVLQGKGSLVLLPKGAVERPEVTAALGQLLGQLRSVDAWERLFLEVGSRAGLYVVTRQGEFYRVRDVIVDPGGESGVLRVTGLGRASRRGPMEVDVEEAYGYMVPYVAYRSPRTNPKKRGQYVIRLPRKAGPGASYIVEGPPPREWGAGPGHKWHWAISRREATRYPFAEAARRALELEAEMEANGYPAELQLQASRGGAPVERRSWVRRGNPGPDERIQRLVREVRSSGSREAIERLHAELRRFNRWDVVIKPETRIKATKGNEFRTYLDGFTWEIIRVIPDLGGMGRPYVTLGKVGKKGKVLSLKNQRNHKMLDVSELVGYLNEGQVEVDFGIMPELAEKTWTVSRRWYQVPLHFGDPSGVMTEPIGEVKAKTRAKAITKAKQQLGKKLKFSGYDRNATIWEKRSWEKNPCGPCGLLALL